MKKIISIDLDGVLNTYDGHFDENVIPPIRDGAKEFLKEISKDYKIEIYTARNKKSAFLWLQDNKILDYIYDVTNVKSPFSSMFIDDRSVNFSGKFDAIMPIIKTFKPYWK